MKQRLIFTLCLLLILGNIFSQTDTTQHSGVEEMISDNSNENLSEDQDDDEGISGNNIPGLLHSSRDVYTNNTSYTFSIAYFRPRGLDNRYQSLCLNGFMMNNMITGRPSFSQWGGLNHFFRYPENVLGMNPAGFTFGNIGGAIDYNLRASSFRKQVRAGYSISNRSYNHRFIASIASGISPKGWSFAAQLSTRFGSELAYVKGTSYTGFSYFVGAEKRFNKAHALSLTAFGAQTTRGMQGNSVNEVYELLDDPYYNPNWGWYQGKRRNARVRDTHEPVIMLSHFFTPENNRLVINTTLATTFGHKNTTSLNWYDAPDPRPDYYRYLPSYQIVDGVISDLYYDCQNSWLTDESFRQINWDKLYNVNQLAALQGKRAQYMIESRNITHFQLGGATNLTYDINDNIQLAAGVDIRGYNQRNYKTIDDMLGGAYWLDVDKYSEGEFPDSLSVIYNDLNNMNDTLHEDDVFGYDYDLTLYSQKAWATMSFKYSIIDFHIGANIGAVEMWRTGNMKNGRFANDSYGKSETRAFLETGAKAGITYKISGRNYLVLNGQFMQEAPGILNAFLASRIRNTYISDLDEQKSVSADFSYIMKYPRIKLRLTGYFTQLFDLTKLISFYHDDYSSMVNYAMTHINQRHLGVELGAEVKLSSMFSLVLAGNYGDYRYSNNASVYMNAENGYDILGNGGADQRQTVYWKNYHVAGTPQVASTIGLKFNHNYWWVNINANYFDKIYCDLNPERRTINATGTLDLNNPADNELYHQIVDQTRLKGQFTLDISVSKSWKIKNTTLGFNISVNNITNNRNLVTTAWEQYRFDFRENNVNKFQNKYYYALGTTFYAGINFSF